MPSQQDAELRKIVTQHVDQLVKVIEESVRREIADAVVAMCGPGAAAASRPARGVKARSMACIAPGCSNASKGPRFRYLCADHMDAPAKDVEAWRAARKSGARQEQAPRKRSLRPARAAGVGRGGARSMDCIAPNCGNRSKGPRFQYLCDKHIGAPKKDVQVWRAAKKAAG